MVCQLPKRLARLRHLQPFAATYKIALTTCNLLSDTFALSRQALTDTRRPIDDWCLTCRGQRSADQSIAP